MLLLTALFAGPVRALGVGNDVSFVFGLVAAVVTLGAWESVRAGASTGRRRTGFWAEFRRAAARAKREQREQALKAAGGSVYYIRSGEDGPVKIGWTGGLVEKRLCALQTGNSQPLRIVGSFPGRTQADERKLHSILRPYHVQGEWFTPQALDVLARTEEWRPTEGAEPPSTRGASSQL
jgi:hypothetical protein